MPRKKIQSMGDWIRENPLIVAEFEAQRQDFNDKLAVIMKEKKKAWEASIARGDNPPSSAIPLSFPMPLSVRIHCYA